MIFRDQPRNFRAPGRPAGSLSPALIRGRSPGARGRILIMSICTTKPTKWPVLSAKTQISLGIRPVWSASSLSACYVLNYLLSAQRRLWSDWGMHRLIWVFTRRTCHFVGFVMLWLKCHLQHWGLNCYRMMISPVMSDGILALYSNMRMRRII